MAVGHGSRDRLGGTAAAAGEGGQAVPSAMTPPPIQSHITSGWLVTRNVTVLEPFDGTSSRVSATSPAGVL